MRKAIITEVACLAGVLLLAFLISALVISNNAFDISANDTYYLDGSRFSPWKPLLFMSSIILGFVVYLIRVIFFWFRVFRINTILVIFACVMLGFIEYTGYNLYSILSRAYWQYAPGTNGPYFGGNVAAFRENEFLVWFKAFLVIILMITSFMTGKFYKNDKPGVSESEQ